LLVLLFRVGARPRQLKRWAANMTDEITHRKSRDWHRPGWRILIIAAPLIGTIFFSYGWYADRVVARRQQTTSGTISAHEPANHDRYGYTFNVNQKTYNGWQIPYDDVHFTIGQVVTVYYDPLDPHNSELVSFDESSWSAFGPVPFIVGILLVAVFIFVRRRPAP
jgi:Protein of unknown function (DUF3592)